MKHSLKIKAIDHERERAAVFNQKPEFAEGSSE
jgi:hypothetical protein